jgi:hypothetical protein
MLTRLEALTDRATGQPTRISCHIGLRKLPAPQRRANPADRQPDDDAQN